MLSICRYDFLTLWKSYSHLMSSTYLCECRLFYLVVDSELLTFRFPFSAFNDLMINTVLLVSLYCIVSSFTHQFLDSAPVFHSINPQVYPHISVTGFAVLIV